MKFKKVLAALLVLMLLMSIAPAGFAATSGNQTYIPGNNQSGTIGFICDRMGHAWEFSWEKAPTCTEDGSICYYCNQCGSSTIYSGASALGHEMGPWYTVEEAAPGRPGLEQCDCIRGDYSETRDLIVEDIDTDYPDDRRDAAIDLTLSMTPTPYRGFFVEGEYVLYAATVYNSGSEDLRDVDIRWGEGDSLDMYIGDLPVGKSKTVLVHEDYVPKENAVYGLIGFTASVFGYGVNTNTECIDSDNVSAPCGIPKGSGKIDIELSMPAIPERGFFVETENAIIPCNVTADDGVTNIKVYVCINDVWYELGSGSGGHDFGYQIEPKDIAGVTVVGRAIGYDSNGNMVEDYDEIHFPTGVLVDDDIVPTTLDLEAYLESPIPVRGYFKENEVVDYTFVVNTVFGSEGKPFDGEFEVVEYIPENGNLGSFYEIKRQHKVTVDDVKNGGFYIYAELFYSSEDVPEGWDSDEIFVPCGGGKNFVVYKTEASAPAGTYYVPGEKAYFNVTVYNIGDELLDDIIVVDVDSMLCSELSYDHIYNIAPGEWKSITISYTVTQEDANRGFARDYIHAVYNGANYGIERFSDTVDIPCGEGTLEKSVVFEKSLWSGCVPGKGARFTEGEDLYYDFVVVNNTDETMHNLVMFDERDKSWYSLRGDLLPGETNVFYAYHSTVTYDDCKQGFAANTAIITWTDDKNEWHTKFSNTVVVPAGFDGSILSGDDYCKRTLVAAGEGAWQYEQLFCAEHGGIAEQVKKLSAAEAAELWQEAIDSLYEQWFVTVSGDNLAAAIKDKESFETAVELFKAAGFGDEKLAAMLENKCAELCYELHTGDEVSLASWLNADVEVLKAERSENCTVSEIEDDLFTETCCDAHAAVMSGAEASGNYKSEASIWTCRRVNAKAQLKYICRDTGDDAEAALKFAAAWTVYSEQHAERTANDTPTATAESLCRSIVEMITLLCAE